MKVCKFLIKEKVLCFILILRSKLIFNKHFNKIVLYSKEYTWRGDFKLNKVFVFFIQACKKYELHYIHIYPKGKHYLAKLPMYNV